MKRILSYLIVMCCLSTLLTGCGGGGYDRQAVEVLLERYQSGESMGYDDYAAMTAQLSLGLKDERNRLEELLETKSHSELVDKADRLGHDKDYTEMQQQTTSLYRILILSQGKFSEENRKQFEQVSAERSIVKLLEDDLQLRLTSGN